MIVDCGSRLRLEIEGVFSGVAGVSGPFVSFTPNRGQARPEAARAGVLDGQPVSLTPVKDEHGPFWTARWEPLA